MSIESELELATTREKLARLRERRNQVCRDQTDRPVDKLTIRSLTRMINQMEEEIVMYRTKVAVAE